MAPILVLAGILLLVAGLLLLRTTGSGYRFGRTLAAVHLLTLGVLTTTAIGASVQLLPVATRRTLRVPKSASA